MKSCILLDDIVKVEQFLLEYHEQKDVVYIIFLSFRRANESKDWTRTVKFHVEPEILLQHGAGEVHV